MQFGDVWAAYRGPTAENAVHRHVAVQISLGLAKPVRLELGARRAGGAALALRPLALHRVVADGAPVALLYVEPQSPLGAALLGLMGGEDVAALPPRVAAALGDLAEPAASVARLSDALAIGVAPLDERLTVALGLLRADPGGPGAVGRAAVAARLSPARLRVLARQELGVPLARWLLWRKLAAAARAVAAGRSLGEAALCGGFADQAHFTRTMRRMFGIPPSAVAAALR